jgi:hypothetical protein
MIGCSLTLKETMEILSRLTKRDCPIPITKEFVKHNANNVQDVEELGFMITIGGSYMEVRMEYKDNELYLIPTINCDEYNIGEPIKYVHELQNLYRALTGKELEIRREWL